MSPRWKTYPPVAADIPRREVIAAWRSSKPLEVCLREIGDYLGIRHLFPVNSGRTALYLMMKATLEPGSKVIVPGYTCFTVPAAVIMAGMTPIISDSDPSDFGYDLAALTRTLQKHPDVKAIVVCHLFGIGIDMDTIREAVGPDVAIIDDAAQAMGIRIKGRHLGTFGDGGFYSFGRGKNLSLAGGGLLVTHDDTAARKIESELGEYFSHSTEGAGLPRLLLYNTATRPGVYNILSRLPGIGPGKSEFRIDFETAVMPPKKVRLLARICSIADVMNADRRKIADRYESILGDMAGVFIPRSKMDGRAGILRFPVLVDDPVRRAGILHRAKRERLGLSGMYPTALDAVPELRGSAVSDLSGAHRIADTVVTLPTHRFIRVDNDRDGVIESIAGLFQ